MKDLFKKFIFSLIGVAVVCHLTLLGIKAFLKWQSNHYEKERLEIKYGTELEERKRKQEEKENLQKKKTELEIESLSGPNFRSKGKILDPNKMDPPLGIKGEDTQGPGHLVFPPAIKKHFFAILEDINDLVQAGMVYTHKDNFDPSDNYANKFSRQNAVLYGAPGTGKSEFVRQLVFEIASEYEPAEKKQIAELEKKLKDKREQLVENAENEQLKTEITDLKTEISELEVDLANKDDKNVPVFQIDGFHLQTAGKALNSKGLDSHEILIGVLKALKEEVFGDAYSDKPYVVFVEEADQGVNVLNKEKGKLLEDWKNFLSTTEDKAGLRNNVQDPNSVMIIATNNYENLDPALFRRGRLGKKLNFSWTPEILKEYGETGGQQFTNADGNQVENWPKIDWLNEEGWKFEGNVNYEELYKMASKFGFASFKKEFASHAQQIIQSYHNLEANKKTKKQNELGTFKNENDQESCNWILHYLYTFHLFNSKQNLHAFTGVEQFQRYDFGHQYRLEEKIKEATSCISSAIINMGQIINNRLTEIRAEVHAQFEEAMALRQDVTNMRNNIQTLDNNIDEIRHHVERTVDRIENDLSRIIRETDRRFSSLDSTINSLSSATSRRLNALNDNVNNSVQRINNNISNLAITSFDNTVNRITGGGPSSSSLDINSVVDQTIQRIKSRLG